MGTMHPLRTGLGLRLPAAAAAAVVLCAILGRGLWAEPADTAKPRLEQGVFVQRDMTRRDRSPVALEAIQLLNRNSTKRWSITWDPLSGLPRHMEGKIEISNEDNYVRAAQLFVDEHKNLFTGIRDSGASAAFSVDTVRITQRSGYTTVAFHWYYKGIKIYSNSCAVQITHPRTITNLTNTFRPVPPMDITPKLTLEQAKKAIREAAAPDTVDFDVSFADGKIGLCIYPSSPPRLTYAAKPRIGGVLAETILDAQTGEFIIFRSMAVGDSFDQPKIEDPGPMDTTNCKEKPQGYLGPHIPVFPVSGRLSTKPADGEKPPNPRVSAAAIDLQVIAT